MNEINTLTNNAAAANPFGRFARCASKKSCFFCGVDCPPDLLTKDYLSPAFNAGRTVAAPDSDFICESCVWFLQEKATINLANQERRENQKVRSYSWVVSGSTRTAYTKAHLPELQAICLAPPAPPFKILLADSGQKHLFYRSEFNLSTDRFTVQLEETSVLVSPPAIAERLALTRQINESIGKFGKSFLSKSPSVNLAARLIEIFGATEGERIFENWVAVYPQPLTNLAVWLTPALKET